jgi:FlaA1/EpsC-like NDP-sugar epimerase
MQPIPKYEHLILLIGDIAVFVVSLWLMLALRYLEFPTYGLFSMHAKPFALLFVVWILVFFLSGLYGKHTRLFRSALPSLIFSVQLINMAIAGLFFFAVPLFGIAPKTNLLLYLIVSAPLIYGWRVWLFSRMKTTRSLKGVLIASGRRCAASWPGPALFLGRRGARTRCRRLDRGRLARNSPAVLGPSHRPATVTFF